MSFFKDVSLIGAAKDLRFFLHQSPKERVIPGLLALLIPGIMIFIFIIDSKVNTAPPDTQEITYVENWTLDRTDEEILADRWEIQCLKDKLAAERKENMKKLARMSGMDPEEIEREAEAQRKARGEVEVKRPEGLEC